MEEKLEIPKCPICGGKHTYKLRVERTFICKMVITEELKERKRRVRFIRIFTCPVKGKKFQATFDLYQDPEREIESVTIEGVIENE